MRKVTAFRLFWNGNNRWVFVRCNCLHLPICFMMGFILSLAGWFLLIIVPLELAGFKLTELESFIEGP